jgi:hypothetical protein
MKPPLLRMIVAITAIAPIALLSPVCAEAPTAPPVGARADFACANAHFAQASFPSKLDYLVFASLADSSRLPALTAYHAPSQAAQSD